MHEVFAYLDDPEHLPEVWPSLQDVRNLERLPNGGTKYEWTYKMIGMSFNDETEQIEHIKNQILTEENRGNLNSVMTWTFDREGEGTKLTRETEYDIPIPLFGKLAEKVIIRLNENEAETVMANIKAMFEG